MRRGGVIIALFVIYHLLDLTFRVANPLGRPGDPYDNLVASFREWPVTFFYALALLAVGLHIRHGIASALLTLGWRPPAGKLVSTAVAAVITAGFLCVPFAVLIGLVQ
jgi:succinate dehydrogenase / fumarate reductase cytochrome b subunit